MMRDDWFISVFLPSSFLDSTMKELSELVNICQTRGYDKQVSYREQIAR